jgi:hypothetical protein
MVAGRQFVLFWAIIVSFILTLFKVEVHVLALGKYLKLLKARSTLRHRLDSNIVISSTDGIDNFMNHFNDHDCI